MIINKFYKKEKLLENEKDLAKQKLSSKPAKAAETVETDVQKTLTQNRQNIPRSSRQNDKSKMTKPPIEIFTVVLTVCQITGEDFFKFCGLFRKHEL